MDTEKSLRLELAQAQADLAEAVRKGDAATLRSISDTLVDMVVAIKEKPSSPAQASPVVPPKIDSHNHVTVQPAPVVVMPAPAQANWRHVPRYGKRGEILELITTRIQPPDAQAQAEPAEAVRKGDALRSISDTLFAMKDKPSSPAANIDSHNHITVQPAPVVLMPPPAQTNGWRHVPRYGKRGEILELTTTRIQPPEGD